MSSLERFQGTVLAQNMCVGCGACRVVSPEGMAVSETADGFYRARIENPAKADGEAITNVCPFSERSAVEDEVAVQIFPDAVGEDPQIGRYQACYAARVNDQAHYSTSSSGGLAKWVLRTLLESGRVDGVVQVIDNPRAALSDPLFKYDVVDTAAGIEQGSRSAYYPVEMSSALQRIREMPGRYVVTGVPCFIKAVRMLQRQDPVFAERVVYTVGIVCGHLKSSRYAEMMAWQVGVAPNDLKAFDFRVKIPGASAKEKGVQAVPFDPARDTPKPVTVQKLFGTDYGWGLFKYNACDFCDDVLAENADVAVGDAWLPQFLEKGTSVVVARNPEIAAMLSAAGEQGDLTLFPLTAGQVAASQASGLRHRREGLAYRLFVRKRKGLWSPPKRVAPRGDGLRLPYQMIYRYRQVIAERSVKYFEIARARGNLGIFLKKMKPLVLVYKALYKFDRLYLKAQKALPSRGAK